MFIQLATNSLQRDDATFRAAAASYYFIGGRNAFEVDNLQIVTVSILENYTSHVIARDLNYVTGKISASSV